MGAGGPEKVSLSQLFIPYAFLEHLLYTGHLKAEKKKFYFEREEEDRYKGKWVNCSQDGGARGRARRSLCSFLFLLGFLFPEPSVTVKMEDWPSRELMLLILCITLGILLLGSLIIITIILLKIKGKYGRCRILGTTEKAQGWEEAGQRCNIPRGM